MTNENRNPWVPPILPTGFRLVELKDRTAIRQIMENYNGLVIMIKDKNFDIYHTGRLLINEAGYELIHSGFHRWFDYDKLEQLLVECEGI